MGRGAEDAVTASARSGRALAGRIAGLTLFAVALAAGAFLRLDRLGGPSYWLDEILGQQLTTQAGSQPWWMWIAGSEVEHGPLYYATQLATRVFGETEAAGRMASALFGVAAIALVWWAARCAGERWAGSGAAAALLALSPLHVYYSREARPYALMILLTAAMLVALLRAARVWVVALLAVALLYTTAVAAPVVLSAAVAAAIAGVIEHDRPVRRGLFASAAACAIAALLFPAMYRGEPPTVQQLAFPALDGKFLTILLRSFTVSAHGIDGSGRTALALLAFAIVGAVALLRRNRRTGALAVAMTLLPVAFATASLWFFNHWFVPRYVAPGVIGFALLAGAGVAAVAEATARGLTWPLAQKPSLRDATHPAIAAVLTIAIVIAVGVQTWKLARTESFRKLDWRTIAAVLRQHLRPGDAIVTAEPWSEVCLRRYLGDVPGVRFAPATGGEMASILAGAAPAAWLVTAGYSPNESTRSWMCRFPLVLASAIDGFRMHYAPSREDYLTRALPGEQRAIAAALGERGFRLEMAADEDVVLASGWAGAEGSGRDSFRWAVGRRATIAFPRGAARDRTIRFGAYPMTHASLPPQTISLSINGRAFATLTLAPEWREYAIEAPAALWRNGMNTLAFDFSRAVAPVALDPHARDARELAASFEWISVDDAGAPPAGARARRLVPSLRAGADVLLDQHTSLTPAPTRFPPPRLRREEVEAFLGRLGYDPHAIWSRVASGEVRIEDLGESVADGSDCEDDAAFLQRAFETVAERSPNEIERRDLLRRLREGATRAHVAGRILRADDVRAKLLQP